RCSATTAAACIRSWGQELARPGPPTGAGDPAATATGGGPWYDAAKDFDRRDPAAVTYTHGRLYTAETDDDRSPLPALPLFPLIPRIPGQAPRTRSRDDGYRRAAGNRL